jgi:hypothetical protein
MGRYLLVIRQRLRVPRPTGSQRECDQNSLSYDCDFQIEQLPKHSTDFRLLELRAKFKNREAETSDKNQESVGVILSVLPFSKVCQ